MSIELMARVWREAPFDGNKLLLLLALADMANDGGYCWPSYDTLAKKARISRTHTMNQIRELIAVGWVKKEGRVKKDNNGAQTSNGYWVTIPVLAPPSQPQLTPPVNQLVDPPSQLASLPESSFNHQSNHSEHQEMFGSIAHLCQVDPKLKAGQIGKAAKSLCAAGYKPCDLLMFAVWWKYNDFRGKKGDVPTIQQVLDKILQEKKEFQPIPVEQGFVNIVLPDGQVVEAKR